MDASHSEALSVDEFLDSGCFFLVQAEDEDTVVLVFAGLVFFQELQQAESEDC